jgi:hypothetical protein
MIRFATLALCLFLAGLFVITLDSLAVAFPVFSSVAIMLQVIPGVAGLVWWLHDGDLETGIEGAAIVVGVIAGHLMRGVF